MIYLFLDTNIFDSCGRNFRSYQMNRIVQLAKDKKIQLIISDVVKGEVIEHIKADINTFITNARKLWKNANSIKNIDNVSLGFANLSWDESKPSEEKRKIILDNTIDAFLSFLKNVNCIEINTDGINTSQLLSDYFNKRLPFENNEHKGYEFKDAFIIYSLRKYIEKTKHEVHVVSKDGGFLASLDNPLIKKYSEINEFFRKMVPEWNLETAIDYVNENNDKISLLISNEIDNYGFDIDALEIDIYDYDVQIVSMSVSDLMVIDEDSIQIVITSKIECKIKYTQLDEENSFWDKETNSYLFYETQDVELNKEISLDFIIDCNAKLNEMKEMKEIKQINDVIQIDMINKHCFGISINPDDGDIEILNKSVYDK